MRRPTLAQVFALSIAALALMLGALFWVLLEGSRRSIIRATDDLRHSVGRRMQTLVERHLSPAQAAARGLENAIHSGAVDPADLRSLEASLFTAVLNNPDLDELTLTRAVSEGFDDDEGAMKLGATGREQLSVYRVREGTESRILTRRISWRDGRWMAEVRDRPKDGGVADVPLVARPSEPCEDPTDHLTFRTTASSRFYGELLWSDLHWSELEKSGDPAQRRAVVTVMKAVDDAEGRFAGVVRAGILTQQLDVITKLQVTGEPAIHIGCSCATTWGA